MSWRRASLAVLVVGVLVLVWQLVVTAASPEVVVLEVRGAIAPPVVSYIDRGLAVAEERGGKAAVIELDTPGGLDSSMREIVQRILNARVPVIVYVSPSGARAASAGTFIAMSAHVAAMAPGTSIGAAHPVAIGQGGGVLELPSTMEQKVVNDAVAYIKGLAELRGRNAEWAEKAVRESASLQASEAERLGVVDMVAMDLASLLHSADGQTVQVQGQPWLLATRGAVLRPVDMSPGERFLSVISDANVAFILLTLGMLALFFELANPGAIFPGVTGAILLLLALFALGNLPVNWAGVLLLVLAFGLFVAEIFVVSHGLLAVGGIVAMIVGGLVLFGGTAPPALRVDPWVIVTFALATGLYFVFVVRAIVQSRRMRPSTGAEGIVGARGVVRVALKPQGVVFVNGERWTAITEGAEVQEDEEVTVTGIEGLRLRVVPKERS
ncbi:MAG: nodulation protein NfeD [Chloroflexi bacterium]|nr:nodulation protein NfeD [Chloroflexota bacterium]